MKYTMTCKCGDEMTVEGESREEAVAKLKSMMDEAAIKAHMDDKHPGEPAMSVAECHEMIEQELKPAD